MSNRKPKLTHDQLCEEIDRARIRIRELEMARKYIDGQLAELTIFHSSLLNLKVSTR